MKAAQRAAQPGTASRKTGNSTQRKEKYWRLDLRPLFNETTTGLGSKECAAETCPPTFFL